MTIASIFQVLFAAIVAAGVGYLAGRKGLRFEVSKKEVLYVLASGVGAVMGLTWFQMANNDPSTLRGKTREEWLILLFISGVPVIYQMLVTWLAFLSVPGVKAPPLAPIEPKPEPPKTP